MDVYTFINNHSLQPVMAGLPITEVVHPRTNAARGLPTIPVSVAIPCTSNTMGLDPELSIAAVNLSMKHPFTFNTSIHSQITANSVDSGEDTVTVPSTSANILTNFQSITMPQKVSGTTVNPLLMTVPTLSSKGINMSFPPTHNLLQTSLGIPTQTVETTGLLQAASSLAGVSSVTSENVTIGMNTGPSESTPKVLLYIYCGKPNNVHYF